jgi:murein DD-endopeptidase MepM/ murein hydrolase activator NlpD
MKPINNILPNIAKDFASIKMGLLKVSKFQQKEERERYFTKAKERASNYERAVRARQVLGSTGKKVAKGATSVVGYIMLLGGIIGIVKLITSINIGQYMVKFITNTFSALFDVAKKSVDVITRVLGDQEVQNSFLKTIKAVFTFLGLVLIKGFDIAKDILNDSDIQEKIKSVFQSVLNNVVDVVSALYDILTKTLVENVEKLKTGIVEIFSAITDLIVAAIITIQDFVSDDRIRASLSNVAVAVMEFIKIALTQEYDDPKTGKKVVAWHKALEWVAEAAFVTGIFLYWKARFLQMGAVLAASGLTGINDCDCSDLLPDPLERRRYRGRRGAPKPKPAPTNMDKLRDLGKSAKEGAQKAVRYVTDKTVLFKNAIVDRFKKVQKNINQFAKKTIKYLRAMATNPKIRTKIMNAFTKRFGSQAAAKLSAFLAAQAATLMAAPVTGGLSLLASALILAVGAYDAYCLYDLLFVSSDGENEDGGLAKSLNAEIEKEEKDTSPKPVAPVSTQTKPAPASAPAPTKTSAMNTPVPASSTAPTAADTLDSGESMVVGNGEFKPYPVAVNYLPVQKSKLTSVYGGRINPVTGQYQDKHNGVDLAVPSGTPILAVNSGTISYAGQPNNISGNTIRIKHEDGTGSGYAHLSAFNVKAGDKVVRGQQIGLSGGERGAPGAGASTGPHLHLVMYDKNGKDVDPKTVIPELANVKSGTMVARAKDDNIILASASRSQTVPEVQTIPQKSADVIEGASNQLTSGLRMLEDLFVTGRPSFTNMSTTINQSNTISRPGGNLRTKENASIQLLIQRQTM